MSWFSFKRDLYADMTQAVNRWWDSVYKPSDFYDRIGLDLSVHICGSEEVIEAKASAIAGRRIDYPGTAGLALYDSHGKPHIFIISTECAFAQREPNYFGAGHELAHILDMHNERQGARIIDYRNPDEGRK
ncbi:MAG TPA: hypothetical protein DDY86_04705 [Syntrophaceae bacterium]|nr:hypothetical protein [Syntrophaceae bacterium]